MTGDGICQRQNAMEGIRPSRLMLGKTDGLKNRKDAFLCVTVYQNPETT